MVKNETSLDNIRHSLAHLLAAAVLKNFPDAMLGIGPTIENGFYYDFLLPRALTPDDLKEFEKTMRALIAQKLPFSGKKLTLAEAKKLFSKQPFKLNLIKDFSKEKLQLTAYYTGDVFVDLCHGGHVENTSEILADAFKLDKLAGAYWRGDEKKPQLQRIYGLAFSSKKELEEYVRMRAEAEKRDHKILGPALDLFTFSELVGSGLPLWTPKGTLVRNLLDDFVWQLRKARGYEQVDIPHITKKDLYEKSGHWEKFKDDLFKIKTREEHLFALKPMNCPHHTQIYARKQWSYRELPQRYASTTKVYRDEQTGELSGLVRVRAITQDDAHVFCRQSQIKEEFSAIWDIVEEFYGVFGFELKVRISLHDPKQPEKYLGFAADWKKAEDILREIAKSKKAKTFEGMGEANFYGPKLDFLAKDSLGREWQVATIQLDINMPERFDLTCINEKGEKERIVMIHAAIMGSLERFLAIAIEHFAGAFPLWLAPVQAAVLPLSEKFSKYASGVFAKIRESGIRVEMSDANDTLGKRIREAEMRKIPYVLVVGEKEEKNGTVNVRHYRKSQLGEVKTEKFIEQLQREIEEKTI
ncbi:MAG: threonine--tRNA ligase [Patescibacteria group bacterium]